MYQIPLEQIPAQEFQAVLDNQNCTITLYQRRGRMYMDLSVGEDVVFEGRICCDRVSVAQYPTHLFSGELYFRDSKGNEPPEYTGLDDRYFLYFLPEGEELPEEF